ncbi:MAG: alpha/beta hydrolase [Maritimibacter sp.]|nr:alpha/beta hydrolase [Maritimibacter sp.]
MDYDRAYANADFIPNALAYPADWARAAAELRAARAARSRLDLAYGPGARQKLDLFLPDGDPVGLVVYIHGGYWMRFDRADWSGFAAGPLARGWAVAMPSYTLAPEARIRDITAEIAAAIALAAHEVPGPIALTGHSAGGHLVARMNGADVPLPDAVAARIARIVAISPVADLRPLLRTRMNATLRLTPAEAEAESPVLATARRGIATTAWVGAEERPAFLDQARWLADAWAEARLHIAPGRHHFDVIDPLTEPESALVALLVGAGAACSTRPGV